MVVKQFFGTDGIRGTANQFPMNAEVAMKLGIAAGHLFTNGNHQHRVIIGKDTRLSGYLIEPALTAGFISVGMDVILVGPMPTPAIAMLTKSMRADLGVMITASHNHYHDNGIKLFGPDGYKLSDQTELIIEDKMQIKDNANFFVAPDKLGRAKRLDDAPGRYIEFVKNSFPKDKTLEGLKIVIDCANGAAYHLGPLILQELGAEIIPLSVTPNGFNINLQCGSTNTKILQQAVIEHQADIGIALDGDADRVLIVDEKGDVVDGDQLIALISLDYFKHNKLNNNTIVTTIMSNIALDHFCNKQGIMVKRSGIGDKAVVEMMRNTVSSIGGEQSGHIIIANYSTTGDGLIAALQALSAFVEHNAPASEVFNLFTPLPQITRNVAFNHKSFIDNQIIDEIQQQMSNKILNLGRVLIRKSGTEPLVRIMAEGEDQCLISNIVDEAEAELKKIQFQK